MSLIDTAKKFGINPEGMTYKGIEQALQGCVENNKNFRIRISEENITFGKEMKYKTIIRKYKIVDIEALKTIVKTNRKRYREDRKHLREKRMKFLIEDVRESNGFG